MCITTLQMISLVTSLIGTILTGLFSPKNRHIIDGGGASATKEINDNWKNCLVRLGFGILCISIIIQLYILLLYKI